MRGTIFYVINMNEKRYYSLDKFYKEKFGTKVFKISLDAGFTCPNKDGLKNVGGCIFCNGVAGIGEKKDSLEIQFEKVKEVLLKKWKKGKFIPFLEANTNTYAPLDKLKEIYEPLLKLDNVVGLNIATRCDSISEEVYDYLSELNKRTYLTVELGLQSSFDETLKLINRGHTKDDFTKCVHELRSRNINVVVHIINGLPYETEEMMYETIRYVNSLSIQGIKFHMLYIEKGTKLESLYQKEKFNLLSKEDYIRIVCNQIAMLDKSIVIHRLISDPNRSLLIEPKWLINKFETLNEIDKCLEEHNLYQGKEKN